MKLKTNAVVHKKTMKNFSLVFLFSFKQNKNKTPNNSHIFYRYQLIHYMQCIYIALCLLLQFSTFHVWKCIRKTNWNDALEEWDTRLLADGWMANKEKRQNFHMDYFISLFQSALLSGMNSVKKREHKRKKVKAKEAYENFYFEWMHDDLYDDMALAFSLILPKKWKTSFHPSTFNLFLGFMRKRLKW